MKLYGTIVITWLLGVWTGLAFNIDPTRLTLSLSPGEVYEGTLNLINNGDAPYGVDVSATDETRHNRSVTSAWYEITAPAVQVPPHTNHLYHFTLRVPEQARGELQLKIAFAEQKPMEKDSPVTIIPVLAIPIYVQIKGTERIEPVLRSVFLKSADPLTVGMTVKNKGNVHFRPIALCRVVDQETGETAAILNINKQNQNDIGFPVFPGREETLVGRVGEASSYPRKLEPGRYELQVSFSLDGREYATNSFVTVP